MFKTVLLVDQDENSKTYTARGIKNVTGSKVGAKVANKVAKEILFKTHPLFYHACPFVFSEGHIQLPKTNEFYWLPEYENRTSIEVLLPSNPQISEWVVLFYNLTGMAGLVSLEDPCVIVLKSKHRIMGFDEPLRCDIPFSSLRLTFMGDINGWVVT
jgi:hypothetical protein